MEDLNNIIESLLFVARSPLTPDAMRNLLPESDLQEIKEALHDLAMEYESRNGAIRLYEIAGGWQIRTLPEYAPWIRDMLRPSPFRMSKAALETLAVVAYRQPVIRHDVEHVRGVDCGGILRMLLERKFVRILGRKEIPGRPLVYATTKYFLEVFGLKSLKDLPTPKEFEELAGEAMEKGELSPTLKTDDSDPVAPGDLNEIAPDETAPKETAPEDHHVDPDTATDLNETNDSAELPEDENSVLPRPNLDVS